MACPKTNDNQCGGGGPVLWFLWQDTLSLRPGEKATWCIGSCGEAFRERRSSLNCAARAICEGSTGLPACIQTSLLGMWE